MVGVTPFMSSTSTEIPSLEDDASMRKFFVIGLIFLLIAMEGAACSSEPTSSIEQSMPDYKVNKVGDFDYVEISGGDTLIEEEGRPQVPYYTLVLYYPKGYRVQDVAMEERSGLKVATGLKLPVVILHPVPTVEMKKGWYPEEEYRWGVLENSDGSTTLVITTFPFYYNPETTEVKYYTQYKFNIVYILSTVSVIDLTTEESAYDPGEAVKIDVILDNSGEANNLVASTLVRRYGSGEIVVDLPYRMLHDVVGQVSFSELWDSGGFPAGDYYVEVTLNDTSGNWLDRRTCGFKLGRSMINVTDFEVEPQHFKLGDQVDISLEIINAGSTEPSGSCIFQIIDAESTVYEFRHNFSSLTLGGSIRFTSVWNTTSVEEGVAYYILGYVSYEGKTTPPITIMTGTNYFPVAYISYSPAKVGLGEEVYFDASSSGDPDGTIASFEWEFGDGGKASGAVVTHAYHELGYYEVFLTTTDDQGASNRTRQVITVVMMYTLNVSSNIGVVIDGSGRYREGSEVMLSAPSSVSMPGILGLLGAKYVLKQWVGALNSTDSTVRFVLTGYVPYLEMRAIYAEDYTGVMIATSIAIIAVVAIVAFSIRKRGKRLPPKPP